MKGTAALVIAVWLLAGCAQATSEENARSGLRSHTHMLKAQGPGGQPEADVAWRACEDKTVAGSDTVTGMGFGYGVALYKEFERCMQRMGYQLIPR